jgi:ATP synthase protein I
MIHNVRTKEERMARARAGKNSILGSVAMLGAVGWSVTIPTLIGIAIGIWIDHRWPSRLSWTLMLLLTGLVIGCASAWVQIRKWR